MLLTTSVFGTKGNCLVRTPHPVRLQYFIEYTTRAGTCSIITSGNVVQLVGAGVLQEFACTIFNQDWVFIELKRWKLMELSVHIKTLSKVTLDARQISLFKRAEGERLAVPTWERPSPS